jgi:hypothetical protein
VKKCPGRSNCHGIQCSKEPEESRIFAQPTLYPRLESYFTFLWLVSVGRKRPPRVSSDRARRNAMSLLGIMGVHGKGNYISVGQSASDIVYYRGLGCVISKISPTHVIEDANLLENTRHHLSLVLNEIRLTEVESRRITDVPIGSAVVERFQARVFPRLGNSQGSVSIVNFFRRI